MRSPAFDDFLVKLYEAYEKLDSAILQKSVGNYTVKELLIKGAQFSFILWLGIAGYFAYQTYQSILQKKEVINSKERILHSKIAQIDNLKRKMKDLDAAYRILSSIFSKENVEKLNQKIENGLKEVYTQKQIVNPIKIKTYNLKIKIPARYVDFKVPTVDGVAIKDSTTYDFARSIVEKGNEILESSEDLRGRVDVSFLNDKIVLLYKKDNAGSLILRPTLQAYFVKDIYSTHLYLASTYLPKEALENKRSYTDLFLGWFLTITSEGDRK